MEKLVGHLRHIADYPDEWSENNIRGKCREAALAHEVYLDPGTLQALLGFVERTHRIKLTVSRSATEANEEPHP